MKLERLQALCAAFPGAEYLEYGAPSNFTVYSVGDRKFAYFKTSEPERWRFSLYAGSERFLELTDMPGIKPARYMGRHYWVTLVPPYRIDDAYLSELLNASYAKALNGLSRVKRDRVTMIHC